MSLGRVQSSAPQKQGFLKEISCWPGKYQLQPTPGVPSVQLYSPTETSRGLSCDTFVYQVQSTPAPPLFQYPFQLFLQLLTGCPRRFRKNEPHAIILHPLQTSPLTLLPDNQTVIQVGLYQPIIYLLLGFRW